jgi:hypothetical protein
LESAEADQQERGSYRDGGESEMNPLIIMVAASAAFVVHAAGHDWKVNDDSGGIYISGTSQDVPPAYDDASAAFVVHAAGHDWKVNDDSGGIYISGISQDEPPTYDDAKAIAAAYLAARHSVCQVGYISSTRTPGWAVSFRCPDQPNSN